MLEHDKKSGMIGPTYRPFAREPLYIVVQTFSNLSSDDENTKWYMKQPSDTRGNYARMHTRAWVG